MSAFVEQKEVASPCVSICALDGDDICVGCFRTGMEISQWGRLSTDQRQRIVERAAQRMAGTSSPCVVTHERD